MRSAPLPINELERLSSIQELSLISIAERVELQEIVTIAACGLKVPFTAITIVEREHLLILASRGLTAKRFERSTSLSAHTILQDQLFEVPDLKLDSRFHDNPHVSGLAEARFYAGVPLKIANGINIGTLCVADRKPRHLSSDERILLTALAYLVVSFIESKKNQKAARIRQETLQNNVDRAEAELGARTDYLAFVTHELRTPISGIISITDALFETEIQPHQRDHLTTILQSSRHLMRLTNDILDFAKIEAGKMSLDQSEFELGALIRQTLRSFHFTALNKGIELDLQLPDSTPLFYFSDPQRISQILTNLVGNAIKFTERGGVKIKVALGESSTVMQQVRIEVSDSGIGMDETTRDALFQPYSQGGNSIQKKFGGTGLGLAISKRLAQILEGDLSCVSQKDKGSTFVLELPLRLQYDPGFHLRNIASAFEPKTAPERAAVELTIAPATAKLAVENVPLLDIPFRALRILIAEDNEISQKVISAMLKKSGCRFEIVDNGLSAVDAFRAGHFDVALLDCHMPKLNGFDAARQIRRLSHGRDIYTPIIGITASSHTHRDVRFEDAGMDDTIEKPFSQDALHVKIRRWLSVALDRSAA